MADFTFPVGYHKLHGTKIIDYQLNRWHSLGYARLEDMREAGRNIRGLADWKGEMMGQAERALDEGRLMNGTFYLRAAEFFTHYQDPDKLAIYNRFIDLFYNQLFVNEPSERHEIPYADGALPAMRIPPQNVESTAASPRTLIIHGGFDSFIEELYAPACYFANRGYEVILFDGPGQGGALKHHGLPMDPAWEKPAAAVLDYFERDRVSWLGISMGGWLCFRAAAFEPRIQRVIASSIAYDYMEIPPKPVADFARWLFRHPKLMETMTAWKIRFMPQERWGIENLMYITQTDTALDAAMAILEFNAPNLHSWEVTQDVLILTGAADHFIPLKMHHLQVAALTAARSITERIFTAGEQAQNHCQIGNFGLALETMAGWLAQKEPASEEIVPVPVLA